MELKEQIKGELLKQKEEKLKEQIKQNSKLKEIELYVKPNNVLCENYIKYYKEQGIKFEEKNIELYNEVVATVQLNAFPIIFINDNYLVQGRDFQNPQQSINAIKHFASPDYVNPPFEHKLLESIKNLQFGLNKSLGNLNRQLQPIVKIMNELAQEESE
tara:strand:- start:281 stop:757 length:477 start_codon:yes stop_codon:yes gene_type:complete